MTALPDYRHEASRILADKVIARLPGSAFGNTEWVTMTTRTGAEHLREAIASNRPHRIANAIRSMAYAPSLDAVEVLTGTICDAIATDGYATRSADTIAQVTKARQIVATVISELRDQAEPATPEAGLLRESVTGYVRLIALRDPKLAERLEAVGMFAGRLARAMKLPAATTLEVELAGRLHDLGMIEIAHQDRFKQHPLAGEAFLREIPSLSHLAPIVRSHHERYDGQGYPDGLHDDEIPPASRIVSVAAAFVDLVTATPQLEALLPNDACRELAVRAGTEFDPDVVTATLHLLRFRQRIRSA
jgi:HD-GYP domain-containing protein (c-di-GMP phosphodiesterase class II)